VDGRHAAVTQIDMRNQCSLIANARIDPSTLHSSQAKNGMLF